MKKIYLFLLPLFLVSCDPADLAKVLDAANSGALTNLDIANGLKQALNFGVDESVDFLSADGGYYNSVYKVLLPEEARKVTDKLQGIPGFSNLEDVAIQKINQAAEDAASKAGPIFLGAIKSITFDDAMNILMGPDDAATNFLHTKTYQSLYGEFQPVIIASLDKFNAQKYWGDAVNKYNMLPFVDDVNPDLADHVTTEALKGLFGLVAKKELGIREDVSQRTTSLLQKVFAKQDGQ